MKSPVLLSTIEKPAMSDGITSGVSWILLKLPPIDLESDVIS